ncbi:MAG: HAD hydrolase family protein [Methanoregula sp.]
MGKPFQSELNKIPDTIVWALNEKIEEIVSFIESSYDSPLYIIGSGGSLTAAHLVKLLHEELGAFARVITPYELLTMDASLRNSSILMITAGGRNPDILFSFKHAAKSEPKNLLAVCMRPNSPLKEIENTYNFAKVIDFHIPSGKDGFLATNSLVAFCMLFSRAYSEVLQQNTTFDTGITRDIEIFPDTSFMNQLKVLSTFSVLYGKWSLPAAIDLESKFTEAALGNVQIADFRNFAHGRHYWLAGKGEQSGIVAIYTLDEEKIVNKTLDLIPKEIPVFRISSDFLGSKGAIQLLIKNYYFTNLVAAYQGVDPGCPTVPMFGRKIYRLNVNPIIPKEKIPTGISHQEYVSIKRKVDYITLKDQEILSIWVKAYRDFLKKIKLCKFGSIILDYDGTLSAKTDRELNLPTAICSALTRLLENGVIIGIATGRGKSVREEMQKAIPREFWNSIVIGYYNGADISDLSDEAHPDLGIETDPILLKLEAVLNQDPLLTKYSKWDPRPHQISIFLRKAHFRNTVKSKLADILSQNDFVSLKFFESSHSFDIVTDGVSKKNLFSFVENKAESKGRPKEILCIGDKGKIPGNDFELLQSPLALSVDEVSHCFENCWNLAPEGYRGPQATLEYLESIKTHDNYMKFNFHIEGNINE